MTEDGMAGWHHRLNGKFEQILGDGEGQGSLVCCNPWVTESDMSQQLNNKNMSKWWRCVSAPGQVDVKEVNSRIEHTSFQAAVILLLTRVQLFVTPQTAARWAFLSLTVFRSLRVSFRGMGCWWPAAGTGELAATVLEGTC